jgi:transposase
VKRAVEKGGSCWRVAARYEVSVSFVVKLMQRWRERGTLTPEPMGGRKPQRPAGHAERVRALVAADPDLTIDGLRRHLADEGVTVGGSAPGRTLLALGLRDCRDFRAVGMG